MIIQQIHEGRCEVENQYKRVVHDDGNPKALEGFIVAWSESA